MRKEISPRRRFLLFLGVLLIFSLGTALFVHEEDMVYEPQDPPPAPPPAEDTAAEAVEEVSAALGAREDFFAAFRTERAKRRDREAAVYQGILADDDREETARKEAGAALTEHYRRVGLEDELEQILAGRRRGDALFLLADGLSLLIVEDDDLDEAEKDDLAAFVTAYAGIGSDDLTVLALPR